MINNYLAETKISAKDNKNKKGEVTSQSYSTVIPKPILNKFGLMKGQVLYWDINDNQIIITPETEPNPEEESIQVGWEIFTEIFIKRNDNGYSKAIQNIKNTIGNYTHMTNEQKIKTIVSDYNRVGTNKEAFKKVVLFLMDYPIGLPDQHEILTEAYNEITKTD